MATKSKAAAAAAETKATEATTAEPTEAVIEKVVEAAAAVSQEGASTGEKSPEEVVASEEKAIFDAAAQANADAPAAPVVVDALSALDAARIEAQALADEENAKEPQAPEAVELTYPCDVVVFNHSHANLTEKYSGAMLAAGGSATVTLPDEEYALSFGEALAQLVADNYLPAGSVVIQAK